MNPAGRPSVAPEIRFWPRVRKLDSGCWEWTGARQAAGYGYFWDGKRRIYAHRWSYEHHVAAIPAGLTIDHLCLNTSCVNPAHMEIVTRAENNRRRHALRKTCPYGHPYDHHNGTQRICSTCRNATKRRKYAEKKAAA